MAARGWSGSCGAQASHSHQLSPDGGQGSCGAQASCGHQLSPNPDHPPAATLVPLGTGTCWAHRYNGGQGSCGAQASHGHQLSPDVGQGSCGAQASHGHQLSPHPDHPPAAILVPLALGHARHTGMVVGKAHVEHRQAAVTSLSIPLQPRWSLLTHSVHVGFPTWLRMSAHERRSCSTSPSTCFSCSLEQIFRETPPLIYGDVTF